MSSIADRDAKRLNLGRHPDVLRRLSAPALGYDVLFSLLIPDVEAHRKVRKGGQDWDIATAVETFFDPILADLQISNLVSVKSQILYQTSLRLNPTHTLRGHVIGSKDLGLAINPVESQLASHVSSSRNVKINFLVYVPPPSQTPTHIVDDNDQLLASNAFLIPRWGGVAIHNAVEEEDLGLNNKTGGASSIPNDATMRIFLSQFRSLLGIQNEANSKDEEVTFLPTNTIRKWERDALLRTRTLENLALTRITLTSLATSLDRISNIVIKDEIGELVSRSVENGLSSVDLASKAASESLEDAYDKSRVAFSASESAFFDPTLLELLYFPEDQKYAIYIPLFLPVCLPVIQSLQSLYEYYKLLKEKKKID